MADTKIATVRELFNKEIVSASGSGKKTPKEVANHYLTGGIFEFLFNSGDTVTGGLSQGLEGILPYTLTKKMLNNEKVDLEPGLSIFRVIKYLQAFGTAASLGVLNIFLLAHPEIGIPMKIFGTIATGGLAIINAIDSRSRVKHFELLSDYADNETVNVSNNFLNSRLALELPRYTSGIRKYAEYLMAGASVVGGVALLLADPTKISLPVATKAIISGSLILGGLFGGVITSMSASREHEFYKVTSDVISRRYMNEAFLDPIAVPAAPNSPNPEPAPEPKA